MAEETSDPTGPSGREERLDRIIANYVEATQRGDEPSREQLLVRFPDLAADLERFFTGLDAVGKHARPLPAARPRDEAPTPDDYEIREEIGRGGMGVVYRAWQSKLKREVALKMVLAGRLASASDLRRFQREAEAAASLRHPHIVSVHEVGEHGGGGYFSMDLLPGGNLADRMEEYSEPRKAASVIELIARAVHYAHERGVLHRDLKPANILLDEIGEPHVSDFGLAKLRESDQTLTETGAILGTPTYMAPEQAGGRRDAATTALDIYSLGAILYELIARRPVFKGSSTVETLRRVVNEEPVRPRSIDPRIPLDLESICLKCLEKNPHNRYSSAGEFADDLVRFLAGQPVDARRVTNLARAWRWCRRNKAVTAVGLLLLVLALGSSIAAILLKRTLDDARRNLREWYLEQARASRGVDDPQRRTRGLEAVKRAAEIWPGPELVDEAVSLMSLVALTHEYDLPAPDDAYFSGIDREGSFFATADAHGRITLRSVQGKELARASTVLLPPGEKKTVRGLIFSADSRFLAVGYGDPVGDICVWNTTSGEMVLKQRTGDYSHPAMDFSVDSRRFALGTSTHDIALHDLDDGTVRSIDLAAGRPTRLRFSPDGRSLAVCLDETTIQILELEGPGEVTVSFPSPRVWGLVWDPGGRYVGVSSGHALHLLEIRGGRTARTFVGHQGDILGVDFHPDGNLLATSSLDSTVRLWDVHTGAELLRVAGVALSSLAFNGNGHRLRGTVGGSHDCAVWSLASGEEFRTLPVTLPVWGEYSLSPDGRILLCGDSSSTRLVDVTTAREVASWPAPYLRGLFHPSGLSIISASRETGLCFTPVVVDRDGSREIWRVGSQVPIVGFLTGQAELGRISLSGDGRILAVVLASQYALLFATERPADVLKVFSHRGIHHITLSSRGKWLATAPHHAFGEDRTVRVWDVDREELLVSLPVSDSSVASFSPDDRWLVVHDPRSVRLVETGTWKAIWAYPLARWRAAFSPSATVFASSRDGRTVELFDSATRRRLATIRGVLRSMITELRFSPDSTRLFVTRDWTASLEVWDLLRIEGHIAELGLDWDLPEIPGRREETPPPHIEVDRGMTHLPAPLITSDRLLEELREARQKSLAPAK